MASKRTRTPLSQGILSFNNSSSNIERKSTSLNNDVKTSPRLTTPTKASTVRKPDFFSDLSISDDEEKKTTPRRRFQPAVHEILTTQVDDHDFDKCGEVQTKTYKMNSPARVIYHSPSSHRDGSVPRQQERSKTKNQTTPQQQQQEWGEKKSVKSLSFEKHDGEGSRRKPSSAKKDKSMENTSTKDLSGSGAKKKKKKFIVVESRFKQPSKKDETLKSKSLELSAITPHQGAHQTSQNSQKKSRVTSTPFLMTSMYEQQHGGNNDGSILDQIRFQTATLVEPPIKAPLVKKGGSKMKRDKDLLGKKDLHSRDSSKETSSKETKHSVENEQLMVDLHQARRLQHLYLDIKARQTFEKQEEKAKNELYVMWVLNRKMEKQIEAITLAIKTKKTEIAIDQLLNAQLNGMKPLSGKLTKLIIKSNRFADALSDSSHYLNTERVLVGDEDTLVKSLDESKSLLADIQALTKRRQPQIEELAVSSEVLMKTTRNEMRQQAQCSELLGACSSLLNYELSLQAHTIRVL